MAPNRKRLDRKGLSLNQGFTLVEVLTVSATVALLSGIVYAMSSGSREKARETVCAGNLHKIYTGLELYSNDWPGAEQMPGLGDIRLIPNLDALLKYVPSHEVFYCPNTTRAMRDGKAWSTYELTFVLAQGDPKDKKNDTYLYWWKTQLENMGQKAPLAICNIHDETYYAPQERDEDPDLVQPFQIRLQLDGAVASGRFPVRRHQLFVH
jgi:prepilin-type N-terminal cleavage/methylation domain-containing protein